MSDPTRCGAWALLWSCGEDTGLAEKTGDDLALLLLELTDSMGRKDVELEEKVEEPEEPLLLPPEACLVVLENQVD